MHRGPRGFDKTARIIASLPRMKWKYPRTIRILPRMIRDLPRIQRGHARGTAVHAWGPVRVPAPVTFFTAFG